MGLTPDWDELKETLMEAGMKPFIMPTYNTNEFKDVDWSFIKKAQDERANIFAQQYQQWDLDRKIKEWTDVVKKMKIMDYACNKDNEILNSMYKITLSESDKEHTLDEIYEYIFEYEHVAIFPEKYKFNQTFSFDIKLIEQARFDRLSRYFDVLVSSIARGIEDCVVKDANKGIWPPDWRFVGRTIVSPELLDDKYQRFPASFSLKKNQILTSRIRRNPPYVVIEDMIYFTREHNTIQMTGFVELAFSEEKFTLYEENNA